MHGKASRVEVRRGKASCGKAWQARLGLVGRGKAGQGMVRQVRHEMTHGPKRGSEIRSILDRVERENG